MTIAETCLQSLLSGIDLMLAETDNYCDASSAKALGLQVITAAEKAILLAVLQHVDDMGATYLGAERLAKMVAVEAKLT